MIEETEKEGRWECCEMREVLLCGCERVRASQGKLLSGIPTVMNALVALSVASSWPLVALLMRGRLAWPPHGTHITKCPRTAHSGYSHPATWTSPDHPLHLP